MFLAKIDQILSKITDNVNKTTEFGLAYVHKC